MDNKFIRNINFSNKAKRIPICFVIDSSTSMDEIVEGEEYCRLTSETIDDDGRHYGVLEPIIEGDPRVKTKQDILIEGLDNFYKSIKEDDIACDSCVSAIITFSDTPTLFEDFDTVDNKSIPIFPKPKGNSNLTPALKMALDILDQRKGIYMANKISYFQPWLVIFTDGQPTDDITLIANELNKRVDNYKLTVLVAPLTKDKVYLNTLKLLVNNKHSSNDYFIPLDNPKRIRKYFRFLAKSVSVAHSKNNASEIFDNQYNEMDDD